MEGRAPRALSQRGLRGNSLGVAELRLHTLLAPHWKQRRVTGKAANILRALERAWIGAILLTHHALELLQGFATMLLQPRHHIHFDSLDVRDPMAHQRAA